MINAFSLYVLLILTHYALCEKKYRYVYSIVRHGARAPGMDKDNFGENWYGNELTISGKRMHYLAGLRDREKYKDFISETYNPEELFLFSTQVLNRTIESIQARMQGLFNQDLNAGSELSPDQLNNDLLPPISNSVEINNKISELGKSALKNSMQITIPHMLPLLENYDNFENNCRLFNERFYNNPELIKAALKVTEPYYTKYKDMVNKVFNMNLKELNYEAYNKLINLADVVVSNYVDNRSFKLLTDQGYDKDYIEDFYVTSRQYLKDRFYDYFYGYDHMLAKVKSKEKYIHLFKTINERVKYDKLGQDTYNKEYFLPKITYFLGHDSSVSAFTRCLIEVFGISLPSNLFTEFACEVSVVLKATKNQETGVFEDYVIDVIYNEVILIDAMPLNIFESKIEDYLHSVSREEYCNGEKSKILSDMESIMQLVVILLFFIILLILVYLMFSKLYPKTNPVKRSVIN